MTIRALFLGCREVHPIMQLEAFSKFETLLLILIYIILLLYLNKHLAAKVKKRVFLENWKCFQLKSRPLLVTIIKCHFYSRLVTHLFGHGPKMFLNSVTAFQDEVLLQTCKIYFSLKQRFRVKTVQTESEVFFYSVPKSKISHFYRK